MAGAKGAKRACVYPEITREHIASELAAIERIA
jgi:hypothetical protein